MAGVIRNLMIRAGADFSKMRKELDQARGDLERFKVGVRGTAMAITAALAGIGAAMNIGAGVNDAIKFEALMGTLSNTLGKSIKDFKAWQNTVGDVMGFSKLQVAEMGNEFSLRLKSIAADENDLLEKTKNLITAAAVIRSKNGMEMTEISERMRSAMNQEQDGAMELGIDVRVTALQLSTAYKKMADGRPWAELGVNMQKLILYHHILEQTNTNFGTEISQNTALLKGGFVAALKDARMALGSAFLPILNVALPLLTRLARAVEQTFNFIAGVIRALFPKSNIAASNGTAAAIDKQAGAADGLGDAYEEAGKKAAKAKGQVMGFDEVHNLEEPSTAGAGEDEKPGMLPDISGGLDNTLFGQIDPASIFEISEAAKKAAEELKKWVKEFLGDGNIKQFTKEWNELGDSFNKFSKAISDLMNNPKVKAVTDWVTQFFGHKIMQLRIGDVQILSGALEGWAGVFEMIDGALDLDFDKFFTGFEDWVSGVTESLEGFVRYFSPWLANRFGDFRDKFSEAWKGIKEDVKKHGDPTKIEVSDFVDYVKDKVTTKWKEIKEDAGPIWKAANVVVTDALDDLKKDAEPYLTAVKTVVSTKWDEMKTDAGERWEKIKTAVSEKWDSFRTSVKWDDIKKWPAEKWEAIKTEAGTHWDNIKKAVSEKWDAFKTGIAWDNVKGYVSERWTTIKTEAETHWETIKKAVSDKWDSFKTFVKWDDIKTTVGTAWTNVKDGVGGAWDKVKTAVSNKWQEIVDLDFTGVKTSVLTVWKAIKTETTTIFDQIVSGIKTSVNTVIKAVNGFIADISNIKIDIPSVDIPGIGKIGGGSIGMPKLPRIPELARGGIVDSETNMGNYIAGEAGTEMIVPLENSGFVEKVAAALGNAVTTALQMNQGERGDTVIQINGVEIARAIQPYTSGESARLGGSMLRTT